MSQAKLADAKRVVEWMYPERSMRVGDVGGIEKASRRVFSSSGSRSVRRPSSSPRHSTSSGSRAGSETSAGRHGARHRDGRHVWLAPVLSSGSSSSATSRRKRTDQFVSRADADRNHGKLRHALHARASVATLRDDRRRDAGGRFSGHADRRRGRMDTVPPEKARLAYTSWIVGLNAAPSLLLYPLFLVVSGATQSRSSYLVSSPPFPRSC